MKSLAVAIVGAACRLPGGGDDLDSLWNLLLLGKDCIVDIPESRFQTRRYVHPDRQIPGRSYVGRAGIVESMGAFDSVFFGMSATEAPQVDPQQRLALELAWEALEDAGIPPRQLADSACGVFFGASAMDGTALSARDAAACNARTMTGNSLSIVANRISYFLNLHGPSLTVDTACSSALHALHLGCAALQADSQLPLVIVGGVNTLASPDAFVGFSKAGMLSPDGCCKAFDAAANGYVRGEGGGALILKRLADAQSAGDHIHAVIRATVINSDGHTSGITLPSREAQEAALKQIYSAKGLSPEQLIYVEAHGTGTAAGDPIEAAALGTVLGRARRTPLPIGSIKTNIGHLEPGSGMAGVLKAILILRHGVIPPSLHFDTPNPAIDFNALNLRVATASTPIQRPADGPVCVGVNSFAFGGSNAHVTLEEAPACSGADSAGRADLPHPPLFLSAASAESLRALAGAYADLLEAPKAPDWYDLAAEAAQRRDHLKSRLVLRHMDKAQAATALRAFQRRAPELPAGLTSGEAASELPRAAQTPGPRTAFVFSGNGSQWAQMGVSLLACCPPFAAAVARVDELFRRHGTLSVLDELRRPADTSRMADTEVAQPLLFAVQVGLVEALRASGITPDVVFGHSVGEAAALWCAGVLSLEDTVTFIHYRSLYQESSRGKGGMAAAGLSREAARKLADASRGLVELAGDNAEESVTLSGDAAALDALGATLAARGVFFKRLALDYPFHSRWMEPFKDDLLHALDNIAPQAGALPFISTVTGGLLAGRRANADYLWRNVRQPVLFRQAAETALDMGVRLFLEIGPHPVLRHYLSDTCARRKLRGAVLPTLTRGDMDANLLDTAWHKAWTLGWEPDARALYPAPARRVPLPRYPWHRQPMSRPVSAECLEAVSARPAHPLLGWAERDTHVWENLIDTTLFPWLRDHEVSGTPLFPAAAYVEIAAAAARALFPDHTVELRHLRFEQAMPLPEGVHRRIRISGSPEDGSIEMSSRPANGADAWVRHMRCRALPCGAFLPETLLWRDNLGAFGATVPAGRLYRLTPRYGFAYGPAFAAVEALWRNGDTLLSRLRDKTGALRASCAENLLPPPLLDAALHGFFLFLHDWPQCRDQAFLPVSVDRVCLYRQGVPAWSLFGLRRRQGRIAGADITLYDAAGAPLLRLEGVRIRFVGPELSGLAGPLFSEQWRLCPRQPGEPAFPPLDDWRQTAQDVSGEADGEYRALLQAAVLMAAYETVAPALSAAPCATEACETLLGRDKAGRAHLIAMLELLARHNLAARAENGWHLLPHEALPDFSSTWRGLLREFPEHADALARLAHAARLANQHVVGGVPSIWIDAGDTRQALGATLRMLLRRAPAARPLRVLELEPGDASALELTRSALADSPAEWRLLCAGEPTLEALRARWSGIAQASFGTLAPVPDPSEAGQGDLVLLAALPADPTLAAAQAFARLCAGGRVLLAQPRASAFSDFVCGRAPEWWSRSPAPDEPASPLLTPEQWEDVLQAGGFVDVARLRDTTEGFMLTARRPGPARAQAAPATPPCEWLVLLDAVPSRAAEQLLEALERSWRPPAHKMRVLRVSAGPKQGHRTVPEFWRTFWTRFCRREHLRVVSLLGFDTDAALSADVFEQRLAEPAAALGEVVRGWARSTPATEAFFILSGGARAVPGAVPVPSQGALTGLGRVLMNELPRLHVRLLDVQLPPDKSPADGVAELLPALLAELEQPDSHTETALTRAGRYCPELAPAGAASEPPASAEAPVLRLLPPGSPKLEALRWRGVPLPPLSGRAVRVRPCAVGLNFRDVMCALGSLPEEAFENGLFGPQLGCEFSGVVEAVGPDARRLKPGDMVVGIAPAALSTRVLADEGFLLPKPAWMSHAAAATLPMVLSTAWYALTRAGQLRGGERLLIHGAAGGVGLMAIQIARHLGAEVFATAGNPVKRAFLRELGVSHVYDSRSLSFADEIRRDTGGEGVDVVLNSLSGDAMRQSLALLRPYGRFLELGKRDLFGDSAVGLRVLRQNAAYFAIDLDTYAADRPDALQAMLAEVWQLVERKDLLPLPFSTFPAETPETGFEAMLRSRHIGKLVCLLDGLPDKAPEQPARPLRVRQDAAYLVTGGTAGFGFAAAAWLCDLGARHLVTGGTAGFGFAAAAWLCDLGARHLVLASRRAVPDARLSPQLNALRGKGVLIKTIAADVCDADALNRALDAALADMPPLGGIIHAAAVLDDAAITDLTTERMTRVLRPKALGAWNLHRYSLDRELDFFLLFSSVAALAGNPGQANYAAANTALETLADFRRARNLPALAVQWGPVADTGMLTRTPAVRTALRQQGFPALYAGQALARLETRPAGTDAAIGVFFADIRRLLRMPASASPRFARLRALAGAQGTSADASWEDWIRKPKEEALPLLEHLLLKQLAAALRLAPDSIDPNAKLNNLGVDSLMSVELGLAVEEALGGEVPHVAISPARSTRELAELLYDVLNQGR